MLATEQTRRLARIANRRTAYEIVAVRSDGTRGLICYSDQHSRCGLEKAFFGRSRGVLAYLETGNAELQITRAKDASGVNILALAWPSGRAEVRFSGRTQRDAIIEGDCGPFIGLPNKSARENV